MSIGLPYNCYYFFLSSKVEIVWSQETSRKYCSLLAYALNMYVCNLDGRYYWKYYVVKRYILTSNTYEEDLRLKKNDWESFALPIMDKLATICFFFPIRYTFYSNKTCESHICNKNCLFHFSITVTEMILKGINENNTFVDVWPFFHYYTKRCFEHDALRCPSCYSYFRVAYCAVRELSFCGECIIVLI